MEAGSAIYSIPIMLLTLEEFSGKTTELEEQLEEISAKYRELDKSWDDRAIRDNRQRADYCEAVDQYREVVENLEKLQRWQGRVLKATWWDRLWATW
jgi:hypothetical protein